MDGYMSALLRGQVASLRDKASQDYTILIYHIWRYPNITHSNIVWNLIF